LEGILMAFDVETGHPGIDRLVLEAKAGHQFPPHMKITERVRLIRRGCLVCKSCDSSNVSQEKPIRMNPVVDGFWASVCLDIFSDQFAIDWGSGKLSQKPPVPKQTVAHKWLFGPLCFVKRFAKHSGRSLH